MSPIKTGSNPSSTFAVTFVHRYASSLHLERSSCRALTTQPKRAALPEPNAPESHMTHQRFPTGTPPTHFDEARDTTSSSNTNTQTYSNHETALQPQSPRCPKSFVCGRGTRHWVWTSPTIVCRTHPRDLRAIVVSKGGLLRNEAGGSVITPAFSIGRR